MRVRDLVRDGRTVIVVEPGATLSEAIELLIEHGIGALPVVGADGAPLGILAERDVVGALRDHGAAAMTQEVRRLMRRPPPMCDAEDSLHEVTARMTRERVRHLLVCDGDRFAAILSVGDLVKYRLEQLETETGVLRDYVTGQRART